MRFSRGCYIAHFRGFIKSTFYQGFFGQGQCQKSESIAAAIWLELKWWSHHQQYSWELSQFQSISMSSPSPSQRSQLNQPTILHWQHWLQCSCIIIIASQFDPYIPGRALAFFYLNHVPDSPWYGYAQSSHTGPKWKGLLQISKHQAQLVWGGSGQAKKTAHRHRSALSVFLVLSKDPPAASSDSSRKQGQTA